MKLSFKNRRGRAIAAAIITAGLLMPLPASKASQEGTPVRIIQNATDKYIIPAFQQFNGAAGDLRQHIEQLCAIPSNAQLAKVRADFDRLVSNWSSISIVRIGPILQHNRLEKLLFWPDRRGIGLRQIQAILAKQDETAISAGGLSQKSVAVQGLAALEYVLYGKGSETLGQKTDGFRCRFAKAISTNVDTISGQLLTEWQAPDGFAHSWQYPAANNPLYRDEKESLSALVSLFSNGLEFYDTVEMGAFLGITPEKDRPRRALFRRSGNTLKSLQTSLSDIQEFYRQSELASLLPEGSDWINEAIEFGFRHGIANLDALDGSATDMLANPQQRAKLAYVRTVVRGLNENFGIDMTAALDLTANFSSLDGD
ncbi:imelysin family protein [Hoeflea sp. TYP-13]|uniref:imelysin family protein n=1 Tax=Hoeflea sp. TYP-13 TaxID=3230023 RepID=UPI0034C6BCD2